MTLSTPTEDPVLSKSVSEIQNEFSISGDNVVAEPKYVVGWTEFSSLTDEQTGYYVAFDAGVENASRVTVSLKRNGEYGGKPATTMGASDTFVFFLGASEDVAESVEGIKVVGYDAGNRILDSKEYSLTVGVG